MSATIVLAGPTACGKSAVATALAEATGGEIVCADAFQLYAGLPILTAQPASADTTAVPHHLYGSVSPAEELDAARFVRMAEECITGIHARGRAAIVTGGSGLYIKALTHGLSPLPSADPALRAELASLPPEQLREKLLTLDPDAAATVNLTNPRYVQRALEIVMLTGRPVAAQRESFLAGPRPGMRGFVIQRERADLYDRINRRTHAMIAAGVLDEVRALPAELSATARKTLGLAALQQVLAGTLTLEDAVVDIQQATRRYAKRQQTWFRRETWMTVIEATERSAGDIAAEIASVGRSSC